MAAVFPLRPTMRWADGLRNMRQRMQDIGGSFAIQSRAGTGTEVSLEFPFASGPGGGVLKCLSDGRPG